MRRVRAFTLVELLVVVGIIALLVAILLPALNKARQQAQSVQCLSDLRQIGLAMQAHASEHRNHFPLAAEIWGPADATPQALADVGMKNYTYMTDNSMGATKNYVAPIPFALSSYLGQPQMRLDSWANAEADYDTGIVIKLFTCPSQLDQIQNGLTQRSKLISSATSGWGNTPALTLRTSYAFNESVLGWSVNMMGANRGRGLLSVIRNPSNTVLMADASPRGGTNGWMLYDDQNTSETLMDFYKGTYDASNPALFDTIRHQGKMNILFCDCHGETSYIPAGLDQMNISIQLP
jgi:prepilin-type processing-associated H-X9-DG protein/prepilin-type N-terminal cleavage/methylation domain-containing protein